MQTPVPRPGLDPAPDDARQLNLFDDMSPAMPWRMPDPADHRSDPVRPAAVPVQPAAATPPADPHAMPPWRHPRAEREVVLGGTRIAYAMRRARRRSIGFTVAPDGLVVAAPRWVAQADVEAGLRAKGDWIVRKLHEQAQRRSRLAAARVDWRDGATLPYLGQPLVLLIDGRVDGVALDGLAVGTVATQAPLGPVPHRCLRVGLPHDASPEQVRDAVQGWLQRQALARFTERVGHFASRLGVTAKAVRLSSAQTRWGSASADGTIRLNWRLVHFAPETIDYVVAHECAHLRHMDHGPNFWDVVRSVVPDVAAARVALRDEVLPVLD